MKTLALTQPEAKDGLNLYRYYVQSYSFPFGSVFFYFFSLICLTFSVICFLVLLSFFVCLCERDNLSLSPYPPPLSLSFFQTSLFSLTLSPSLFSSVWLILLPYMVLINILLRFSYMSNPHEEVTMEPIASKFLFNPTKLHISVSPRAFNRTILVTFGSAAFLAVGYQSC